MGGFKAFYIADMVFQFWDDRHREQLGIPEGEPFPTEAAESWAILLVTGLEQYSDVLRVSPRYATEFRRVMKAGEGAFPLSETCAAGISHVEGKTLLWICIDGRWDGDGYHDGHPLSSFVIPEENMSRIVETIEGWEERERRWQSLLRDQQNRNSRRCSQLFSLPTCCSGISQKIF